jgi:magnesium transporter
MDGVIHRHTKPGTAPGTLAGRAPVPDEALDFTLVEYTSEDVQVLHGVEVDECRFHLGTPGHTWIDVAGRPSSDMLRDLGMAFNLHPLALEDVFHANQRSKLDLYEGQGFIVLNDPIYEDEALIPRQVSIFFGDNYVISFPRSQDRHLQAGARSRADRRARGCAPFGIDYLGLCAGRPCRRPQVPADRGAVDAPRRSSRTRRWSGRPTTRSITSTRRGGRWSRSTACNGPSARRCWR